MAAISTTYTKKVVMHSQVKLGYWPKSNLLKSSVNTKQPSAKTW